MCFRIRNSPKPSPRSANFGFGTLGRAESAHQCRPPPRKGRQRIARPPPGMSPGGRRQFPDPPRHFSPAHRAEIVAAAQHSVCLAPRQAEEFDPVAEPVAAEIERTEPPVTAKAGSSHPQGLGARRIAVLLPKPRPKIKAAKNTKEAGLARTAVDQKTCHQQDGLGGLLISLSGSPRCEL